MANNQDAPVFANRYRFEPVDNDWDVGRSGYTHRVYDLKKNRYGVIKRAEINSKQANELRGEVEALKALKGLGVPEIYETGQAVYGSKNYEYMVMEYIDGIRLEKGITSLSKNERIEILTQFFSLLAQTHYRGIVNGDIDLKHLFWKKDKKLLIVIDWGNAKLNVDTKNKSEFAYDLARSAEIIYALVANKVQPPATGSLALPEDAELFPGLSSPPVEFLELCQWAPRKPVDGFKSPVTTLELLEAIKIWGNTVSDKESKKGTQNDSNGRIGALLFGVIIVFLATFAYFQREKLWSFVSTSTPTTTQKPEQTMTRTPSLVTTPSVMPGSSFTPTATIVLTSTPVVTLTQSTPLPTPHAYSPILVFDNKLVFPDTKPCWKTNTESANLTLNEGFYRRSGDKYYGFRILEDEKTIPEERPINIPVFVDLYPCLNKQTISGIGLNAYITKIVPERDDPTYAPGTIDPGREFGIFVQNTDGVNREYTLWVDKAGMLHLKIRESGIIVYDNSDLVVSQIQTDGAFPRTYKKFFIQIFLEINNNGTDAIYLLQGSANPIEANSFDPIKTKMLLKSILPTLGDVQKIGLVGYGGETQVLIWPLAIYSNTTQ